MRIERRCADFHAFRSFMLARARSVYAALADGFGNPRALRIEIASSTFGMRVSLELPTELCRNVERFGHDMVDGRAVASDGAADRFEQLARRHRELAKLRCAHLRVAV